MTTMVMERLPVEPSVIECTLENVRKRQRNTVDSDQMTQQVIQYLRTKLDKNSEQFLKEAEFEVVGSTAEDMVTSHTDDRDLLLILGPPYTPQYFKSVCEAHGRHFLKWNGSKWKGGKPRYVDANNHLCPVLLRKHVNTCMQSALEGATISGFEVTRVFLWKQTVRATLKGSSRKDKYIVDVIPQIKGGSWSSVKGVEALSSLSHELQLAVKSLETAGKSAILFSLFAAPGTSHLLLTTSYALLEREFFPKNENLRDIVLLGKLMLAGHRWKDWYGLKSAHLKRVVLANTTTLVNLSPWEGMQELWGLVVRQLKEGSLDGFPDKRSDLLWHKTEEDCEALALAITKVLNTLNPAFFQNYL